MRESATAVAVTQRPDPGHAGSQLVVNSDEAASVHRDAGGFQPEIVGIGSPPDGQEQMRSGDPRSHAVAGNLNCNVIPVARYARNAAVDVGLDPFAAQDIGD